MSKSNETTPNVPTLRFAEYTDEWHKYALSDFVTRITRRNKNNESSLPLTISAQYGLVDQITFFNKTVASVDLSGYYLLYNGDFAYNKSYSNDYAWGAVKRLDKYEKGCLSSLYFVFRPTDKVDSDYLTHYFETNKWHKGISDIAGEGARNHGLLNMAVDDYFATKHYLPSLSEQKKIACFLNLITKRIEIQNKIISKYETLIKGLYTQLQSKSAKKEYRICDIVKCHLVGLLSKEDLTENGSKKCILYGELFTTYDEVINEIKSRTNVDGYISQGNEILFPSSTTVDAMSLIAPSALNEKGILLGGDMFVLELLPGFNNEYISYYLNTIAKKNLAKYAQGTTIKHLYFEHIKNVLLYLPDITIQLSVASKMRKLKTKIQIEKEMLSALQKQKAFLIQSMFI